MTRKRFRLLAALAGAAGLQVSQAAAQGTAATALSPGGALLLGAGWFVAVMLAGLLWWRLRVSRPADSAHARSAARLAGALEHIPHAVAVFDSDSRLVAWNAEFNRSYGTVADAPRAGTAFETLLRNRVARGVLPDEARGKEEEWIRERLARFGAPQSSYEVRIGDRWREVRTARLPDGGTVLISIEITEQKARERAFRTSAARLRRLLDSLPDGVMVHDGKTILYANPQLATILDAASPEELIGADPMATVAAEDRPRAMGVREHLIRHGRSQLIELRCMRRDGTVVPAECLAVATDWEGSRAVVTVFRDVSERVAADARMRTLIEAIDAIGEGVMLCDAEDRIVYSNAVFRLRNRVIADRLVPGMVFEDYVRAFVDVLGSPDAHGRREDWVRWRMDHHRTPRGPFEMAALDGSALLVTEQRLENGHTLVFSTDITAFKETENRLRQAQKMEVVGQLTGGVAHDFNNLLTVILGNLEILADGLAPDAAERKLVEPAISAAQRGARLTTQLLAFSRRQPLAPKPVDVGRTIREMTDILRRTLGEAIAIEAVIDAGLWTCEVDPGQLQNAILNLAVNARDAMPNGGKLTLEANNARLDEDYVAGHEDLKPGQYIALSVTDTGVGMSPDVAGRVFEPFFTTKEPGEGSGLGLSMIYGFAKQSGGHVTVYSEPGQGTTFRLYLPRLSVHADERNAGDRGTGDALRGRGEIVLVVEDDPDVRALAVAMLTASGYTVLEADSGAAAFAVAETAPRIDLLLTDVVLPGGLSGRNIADRLSAERPRLSVVYMSGYTANAVIHDGRLDEGVSLLQKPFRKIDLQRKLRSVLDGG